MKIFFSSLPAPMKMPLVVVVVVNIAAFVVNISVRYCAIGFGVGGSVINILSQYAFDSAINSSWVSGKFVSLIFTHSKCLDESNCVKSTTPNVGFEVR